MYTLKKSLGQHFLKDDNICKKIISALQSEPFSQLLEVGPGGGALTRYLLKMPDVNFKAVEIDQEKITYLTNTYPELKNKVIQGNILEMPPPFTGSFSLVGNFPYNISTQILFTILKWKEQVPLVVGMFQKEVAQRIAAPAGSKVYGVLSVLIQAFFDVEYLFDVHEKCFVPPPNVKSGVIKLFSKTRIPDMTSEQDFTTLVKTAFNQRRKTLRNATRHLFNEAVLKNNIFEKRAEQLTVKDFADLTFKLK